MKEFINIYELMLLIKKEKRFFLKIFISLLFLGFVIFLILPPYFMLDSKIEFPIRNNNQAISSPMNFLIGNIQSDIDTETEYLQSRSVIDYTIKKLHLQYKIEKKWNSMFLYIYHIFSRTPNKYGFPLLKSCSKDFKKLLPGTITSKNQENFSFVSTNNKKCECSWNKECSCENAKFIIDKTNNIPKSYLFSIKYEPKLFLVRKELLKYLDFEKKGSDTNPMLQISYEAENPFFGKIVLNTIINRLEELKDKWEHKDSKDKEKYISKILEKLHSQLEKKAKKLALFQSEKSTVMPTIQLTAIMQQQMKAKNKLEELKIKQDTLTKIIKQIQSSDSETPITIPLMNGELAIQELLKRYNALIFRLSTLKKIYTDSHPDVIASKDELNKLKPKIEQTISDIKNNYATASIVLKKALQNVDKEIKQLPGNIIEIEALKKDIEIVGKIYSFLNIKYYDATIDSNEGMKSIRIIDYPTSEIQKYSPSTVISIIVIILVAFFLSLSIILINNFIKSEKIKNETRNTESL